MNSSIETRNKKRLRSVQEEDHNDENEIGLQAQIDAITVQITTQEKVLEDARDTSAETQLALLRQIIALNDQLDDLRKQLDDLRKQIANLQSAKILGNIINGLIYDGCYL